MRFYLRDRGGIFYICWTDRGIPRRVSTGLRDRGAAEIALARHVLIHANPRHQPAELVTVQGVVLRYWQHYGRQLASRDSVMAALKAANTYLEHVTVADFGLRRQEGFVRALRADGLAEGSIKRWLGVIGAALRWAHGRQELAEYPPLIRIRAVDGEGVRPTTVEELHALTAACLHEHQRRFLLLAIGTAARPGALVDLTWDRVDFETGTIVQALPGIDHGNKRRPRVPMPASVATYLAGCRSVGPVVQWKGKALADHRRVYAGLAERAGEILRATLPIRVAIERADDGYVAENKRLDIFAFGDDPSGALSEFRSQLFSLYEHYTALSEDEVMGEAAEMRLLFLNKFTLLRTEGR